MAVLRSGLGALQPCRFAGHIEQSQERSAHRQCIVEIGTSRIGFVMPETAPRQGAVRDHPIGRARRCIKMRPLFRDFVQCGKCCG